MPGEPHWDARLLALAELDAGPARRLRAVSAAAGRLGLRAGMTVAAARARCAALEVWPWDDAAVARAVDHVTAALLVASPQVTPAPGAPGLWWVGAAGLDAVGGERGLARALHRVAAAWHPAPRVGLADSCVAARAATWHYPPAPTTGPASRHPLPPGVALVPPGGDAAWLAGVPLALVPMDDELRAALAALGIVAAGGLAALAPGEVEARWGAAGLAAWRLARGDDRRRPGLRREEARRSVGADLAVASPTLEPVLFLVRAALDRLAADLARDGVGAAVVAITLALDVGATRTVTREVRLARPLARAAPLFERCRALLERVALPAPVAGVTVAVTATGRLGADQGDLLTPAWHDPVAAEAAFARLRAELGPNVVVRPALRDGHRPERTGAWEPVGDAATADARAAALDPRQVDAAESVTVGRPWDATARRSAPGAHADPDHPSADLPLVAPASAPAAGPVDGRAPGVPAAPDASPVVALRLLDRPEPAEVEVDGAGVPVRVRWRQAGWAVARADGPERLSGEWWSEPYRRDYWRCATAAGLLLVFREPVGADVGVADAGAAADAWCVQGWYD